MLSLRETYHFVSELIFNFDQIGTESYKNLALEVQES